MCETLLWFVCYGWTETRNLKVYLQNGWNRIKPYQVYLFIMSWGAWWPPGWLVGHSCQNCRMLGSEAHGCDSKSSISRILFSAIFIFMFAHTREKQRKHPHTSVGSDDKTPQQPMDLAVFNANLQWIKQNMRHKKKTFFFLTDLSASPQRWYSGCVILQ